MTSRRVIQSMYAPHFVTLFKAGTTQLEEARALSAAVASEIMNLIRCFALDSCHSYFQAQPPFATHQM